MPPRAAAPVRWRPHVSSMSIVPNTTRRSASRRASTVSRPARTGSRSRSDRVLTADGATRAEGRASNADRRSDQPAEHAPNLAISARTAPAGGIDDAWTSSQLCSSTSGVRPVHRHAAQRRPSPVIGSTKPAASPASSRPRGGIRARPPRADRARAGRRPARVGETFAQHRRLHGIEQRPARLRRAAS